MIPGITITLGDRDWLVPPLTLVQVREALPRVKELAGIHPSELGSEQLTLLAEVITTAMQRNYPDLTVAEVEGMLDLSNTPVVLAAVLGGRKPE
jgi:hypothetical protein